MNLVFTALLFIIYLPIFPADFFPINDALLLNMPVFAAPFSLQSLKTIFTVGAHVDFYPVRDLSYLLDWKILGGSPAAFRFTNFAIFISCVFLLRRILVRLGSEPLVAVLGAWGWAFLPSQLESVAWISSRKDVLSFFFALLAFCLFLEGRRKRNKREWYASATLAFVFCLLSKANFLLLPILGLVLFHKEKQERNFFSLCAALGLGSALFVRWFYSTVNPMAESFAMGLRAQNVVAALGRELAGWFLPSVNLVIVEGFRASPWYLTAMGGIFLLALLAALAVGLIAKKRNIWAIALGSILLILPIPNVVSPHYYFYSTRYLAPLCAFLAIAFFTQTKKIPTAVLAFFLLAMVALTYREAQIWENPHEVLAKSFDAFPDGVGPAAELFTALKNLEQTDHLEQEGRLWAIRYQELEATLQRKCLDPNADYSVRRACRSFYQIDLREAYLHKDTERAAQVERAILASGRTSQDTYVDRFKVEQALLRGDLHYVQGWRREWLATPSLRAIAWASRCLRGEGPSGFFQKLLLDPGPVRKFIAYNVHPLLQTKLRRCLLKEAVIYEKAMPN